MGKSMHAWQDFHTAKPRNEPIGKVEIVPDLLPSPEEFAFREEGVKVSLTLSKNSVGFRTASFRPGLRRSQRMHECAASNQAHNQRFSCMYTALRSSKSM
jgi:hypothetical protein